MFSQNCFLLLNLVLNFLILIHSASHWAIDLSNVAKMIRETKQLTVHVNMYHTDKTSHRCEILNMADVESDKT